MSAHATEALQQAQRRPSRQDEREPLLPRKEAHHPPGLDRALTGPARTRLLVLAMILSSFLSALDLTIVATCIPAISSDLRASERGSWIGAVVAYSSDLALNSLDRNSLPRQHRHLHAALRPLERHHRSAKRLHPGPRPLWRRDARMRSSQQPGRIGPRPLRRRDGRRRRECRCLGHRRRSVPASLATTSLRCSQTCSRRASAASTRGSSFSAWVPDSDWVALSEAS